MPIDGNIPDERPERSGVALEEASDSDGSEVKSLPLTKGSENQKHILSKQNNDPINISAESLRPSTTGDRLVGGNSVRQAASANRPKLNMEEFLDETPMWFSEEWQKAPGASDNNFEVLLKPLLEREDKKCAAWKEEVQNLLILAGLFSAVVTAFIIESYQTLQPDPNDQIIFLLSRILDQTSTSNGSISSHPLPPSLGTDFTPSPANVRVNIYWFISLVLSLTVALIGIVTLQWLREYQRYDSNVQSMDWFGILNARSDGLQRWYIPQIFTGLPLLLQAALVLFFVGLVEFLFAIRIEVAVPVSVSIVIPIAFLIATTILPTLQLYTLHLPYFLRMNDRTPAPCPYKSPQALIFQRAAVASTALFSLSTWICGVLWIPFVIVIRLFVWNDKPFYRKSAPFSKTEDHYQYFCDRLRNAASNWMEMDMQWLATRTSYAMSIQTPDTFIPLPSQSLSNDNFTDLVSFYDCINGMKNMVTSLRTATIKEKLTVFQSLYDVYQRITKPWSGALAASSEDPELGHALQGQVTALLRVIGPFGQQQIEKFVEQSEGDMVFIHRALVAVFYDQALSPELDFSHRFVNYQVNRHLVVAHAYLSNNAEEVFRCSNVPGITLSVSPSTRRSFLRHRVILEEINLPWMTFISRYWTDILKHVIMDAQKMIPHQTFARRCTGSSSARCGSNLHTESIVELTEYILLFQVPPKIQETSRLLYDLIQSQSNPLQDRPFVLIIACAYINAVANVNQDGVDEFRTLLHKICKLCGSLDPTLEARPGGPGRHWPKMEDAFDYIRNNCHTGGNGSAHAVPQSPDVPHSPGVYEKVRQQFIRWKRDTRTQEHVC